MKIALVASSYLPSPGRLERHVDQLARGLARRGAEVEVFAQGLARGTQRLIQPEGIIVRRFPTVVGSRRFAVAPGLWERLRHVADEFDLADVHAAHPPLALAAARAGFRRLVYTPHVPVHQLASWPYARAVRAVIGASDQVVCPSSVERDLLRGRFAPAAHQISVVPTGVDAAAIRTARPFATSGSVVLTVGGLRRSKRVDRVIAAIASLNPAFRLVVVGDGPARRQLHAYAADLRVASRVAFAGPLPDAELYRWLRTARVAVTLSEQHGSGLQITEALAAGAAVVASDIPAHTEAAEQLGGASVIFVSPEGSPLEVADAIEEAARLGVTSIPPALDPPPPSWDSVVDRTWDLYEQLVGGARTAAEQTASSNTAAVSVQIRAETNGAADMTIRA